MVQFSCVFKQWCFLQKSVFSNVISLRCRLGVITQTEGKMSTEVLLYVSRKQTNLIKATRSKRGLHPGLA